MSRTAAIMTNYLDLSKIRIMLPVTMTGFTGYFMYEPRLSGSLIIMTAGIFLLAISASSFNQVQEAETDSRMARTMGRPIPSGRISKISAIIFSAVALLAGSCTIWKWGGPASALTGFLIIAIYNGIYTPLKRITPFAVIPGALAGALPPFIGWIAAGGGLTATPVLLLSFLLFIGQVPHFWLLVMKYGEEYRSAGIPSLIDIFSPRQISRLTFLWIATFVVAALFLCLFGIINAKVNIIVLFSASAILLLIFSQLPGNQDYRGNTAKYSIVLNSYFLLLMILLISERVFS